MNDFSVEQVALANIHGELLNAHAELSDAARELNAVEELMVNIQKSISALSKYGADAIPQLNLDGGLESLMGIPEKLITAEKAVKALEDQQKGLWERFKEWVIKIFNAIKSFFKNLFTKHTMYLEFSKKLASEIKSRGPNAWDEEQPSEKCILEVPKIEDFVHLIDGHIKMFKVLKPVLDKIKAESVNVEKIIASDQYEEWNNKMIKEIGDAVRSLQIPLANIGYSLKVTEDGTIKMFHVVVFKNMPSILGPTDRIENVETEYFQPLNTFKDSTTLGQLGWSHEAALAVSQKVAEMYEVHGHIDETWDYQIQETMSKFVSAIGKADPNDNTRVQAVKSCVNSIMSFYQIGLKLQDYGFYHVLNGIAKVAWKLKD